MLLEDDEQYLKDKGYVYDCRQGDTGQVYVIIKDYPIPPGYTRDKVDLMVIIPAGYPISPMDMFWVNPEIRYVQNSLYPKNADIFEDHIGIRWQRFSRHYITHPWRPGVDSLSSHLIMVQKVLEEMK